MKKSQPQNILLINLKYLGDLIICSAAIRAVKNSFPNSNLTFLVRSEYKDVLKGNVNLREIISYDSSIKKQTKLKRLLSELKFVFFLRSKKYDAVISLQAGDRYAIWSFLSGAKIRVAPIQNNFAFLLTKKTDVWEDKTDYLNYYLSIVEDFGAKRNGIATDFMLDKKFKYWAEEILLNNRYDKNTILIGVHPGASEPTKVWPFDNFQNVISKLTECENVKVVLFLGPAEQKMKYLISGLNENVFVIDTSENIQQLAWLINNCALLICNDSGARHLSAALKVPTITLFPEDKILPWKFYSEDQKQFFLIGKRNTNSYKKSFLDGLDPEEVVSVAKNILELK